MASDFEKPDKIHTLYPNEIKEKMWPLPVRELLFLGRKTAPKLINMKIRTIGDIANTDENFLIKKFGKFGKQMWEYANGIDNSEVIYTPWKPKGIGMSTTLPVDVANLEKLEGILANIVEQVCYRLRKQKMKGSVVNVGLRTKDFVNFSHQAKMIEKTDSSIEIFNQARKLLIEMYKPGTQIRLIGVRIDKLESNDEGQISIFEMQKDNRQSKIDATIDTIKEKYGFKKISRGNDIKINVERKSDFK